MKVENLTKTNLTENLQNNYKEIEKNIGVEIDKVYNYNTSDISRCFMVENFDVKAPKLNLGYECKNFKFDEKEKIIYADVRDRWQRIFKPKKFSVEIIGYKLKTTHLSEGYIYGKIKEIKE